MPNAGMWAAATISYRLGFYSPALLPNPYAYDQAEVVRAAYRAQQEVKGAIRFLRARQAQDSTHAENVFVCGVSAGGITAMHVAYATANEEGPVACAAIGTVDLIGQQIQRPDLGPMDGELNLGESAGVKACVFTNDKCPKKDFVFRWVTKYVSKKAKGITAVSSFLQKGLKENNISESIVVIPNVVEKFEGAPKLKFDNTKINILTIADLDDDVKNISAIITALSNIKNETKNNFIYHIVGHGKDELKLKHLVAEYKMERQIIFYGLKENNEVLEFIASCNFVVINSRVETFSVVLAEAFMSGKPAIVTACGGTQEIFRPENGIMISIDDNEGLQNAIEYAFQI